MAKLRKDSLRDIPPPTRSLRILASGTLFLTHTLADSRRFRNFNPVSSRPISRHRRSFPRRFSSRQRRRQVLIKELEKDGLNTRYCKVWPDLGVPSAWVIQATENDTKTVVNHNPLPDITHEEFVSLLGPLLVPENYTYSPTASPTLPASSVPSSPSLQPYNIPAPLDWVHFEGRSVKTTLSNITGLEGLARERNWRSHCVFSVDVGRKSRQGIEALIPHADVLFLNKHYAEAQSPNYATTPRAFLLSLMSTAPPHALLIVHWGSEGAAALSLPTKEYFQSSGWAEKRPSPTTGRAKRSHKDDDYLHPNSSALDEVRSVRTASDFWAGRSNTPSSSAFTAGPYDRSGYLSSPDTRSKSRSRSRGGTSASGSNSRYGREEDDNDSQGTEVPEDEVDDGVVDEVGAQDAFVAGMIYALTRRILPGAPFTPVSRGGEGDALNLSEYDKGRWRLDECLRFATELAGRKARRRGWSDLAEEMGRAGWFDA
ncbi:hypothetical protein D9757_007994 [Collybiopsis confluens]|uniref:Carbohydrate kinase PfkB domain-containing protein n=1 Tax=Collybiopsis confluens TaxID=2823264 RepID=A0A8H5M1F4_9AGAR|nr:hypothetical protein D9757_007994 [Collybiopsis confluens]